MKEILVRKELKLDPLNVINRDYVGNLCELSTLTHDKPMKKFLKPEL